MHIKKVVDDIYRLSVNIEDPNYLFEGIWPMPHGISINGYLIKGEKNVIIDLTRIFSIFLRKSRGRWKV